MGPMAGLDEQKISSPPGFDPGPSSPQSVAIPTELPGSQIYRYLHHKNTGPFFVLSVKCKPNSNITSEMFGYNEGATE